jgi:hypothetical protein
MWDIDSGYLAGMSNKSWIILAISYAALCVLVTFVEGPGFHHEALSTRLDKLLAAPFCWGLMLHGLQFGYVKGRFSTVERDDSPVTYWVNIVLLFLLGLFFVWWSATSK